MIVDIHTHVIPRFVLDEATGPNSPLALSYADGVLTHAEGMRYPVTADFLEPEALLARLDVLSMDAAVVSLAPTMFGYDRPPAVGVEFARRANDDLAALVAASDRLAGLATLPLADPPASVAELERAVRSLGLRGAQLGTHPGGRTLDHPDLEPVLAAAERLDVPVLLHPHFAGPKPGLERFYLTNTLGNPVDSTVAAASLIHAGTLERLSRLRVVLVHGGGFLPYQLGRLDRAYAQRDEPRVALGAPPSTFLERFWIDTITHDDRALAFLREAIGDARLVLGTDLPFDMADPDPVERLERIGLDPHALGAAAVDALGGRW